MLTITNLHVSVKNTAEKNSAEKNILRGVNLKINPGETHVIMGPNGSGKSTLANVLVGREGYIIKEGEVIYQQQSLLTLVPEERAHHGLFLAFQYPAEIPGVNNLYFLRAALNALRKSEGLPPLDAADFLKLVKQKMKEVGLDDGFSHRSVNAGFSGGEKKRNEILQMLILNPKLIILDETDSGLDIDALQTVGKCVTQFKRPERSFLIITHYQRLLDYIEPDVIHVMAQGQIVKSGNKNLARDLEVSGYGFLESGGGQ